MQGAAIALDLLEMLGTQRIKILGKDLKFGEKIELQIFGKGTHFCGACGIEDDLKHAQQSRGEKSRLATPSVFNPFSCNSEELHYRGKNNKFFPVTMNNKPALFLASILPFLAGCTTEVGADGQPHSVMTPLGVAAVQAVTAAGIGAGTGALCRGVNPVATGAIAAGAGSVGSQAITAFIPKAGQNGGGSQQQAANGPLYRMTSDGSFVPAKIRYTQMPDGTYAPRYPEGVRLYRQLQNGSFVQVQ